MSKIILDIIFILRPTKFWVAKRDLSNPKKLMKLMKIPLVIFKILKTVSLVIIKKKLSK